MESILVKIFATALALSQVTTAPDAVKTRFERAHDQQQVAELLRAGCTHMRKAFDIEDINLEELIATAMDDPQAVAGESKVFHGINFADLQTAYRQFCKNENVAAPAVDLGDVIDFYNKATADLPDHTKLKGLKLPGASVVLDRKGERFAEVFEENQRRVWVPLADIPEHVQKAFLAAEDKRFYQHKGIDERGLIRAFIGNLAASGRPQGGSTITQQIVKNLLVGEDLTYERKIREMIVASRAARRSGSPTCSAACRRMARSRPSSPAVDCPRCRRSCPTNVRAATAAFISSIRSRGRQNRLPESTRSRRTPTRCAPPSIRNCSGRWKRRCRRGSRATSAAPAASSSAPPRRTSPKPSSGSKRTRRPATSARPGNAR